jgi:predicted ATPase
LLRRYVLTGAPGAGKTSILKTLQDRGYQVVGEAATDVIAREQALGVDEPWREADFVDKIVALQRQRQLAPVPADVRVQVFDRSPLCTLALALYLGEPVTPRLAREVARVTHEHVYEGEVFFVRPLGFVERTAARRISYRESLDFEAVHEGVYRRHRFDILDVSAGPVSGRADAIDSRIAARS